MSASSAAIRASRAVQLSHSGAGGGRPDTSHDHPEPAGSKQADTPDRLTTTTSQPVNHPPSPTSGQARQEVNVYPSSSPPAGFLKGVIMLFPIYPLSPIQFLGFIVSSTLDSSRQ